MVRMIQNSIIAARSIVKVLWVGSINFESMCTVIHLLKEAGICWIAAGSVWAEGAHSFAILSWPWPVVGYKTLFFLERDQQYLGIDATALGDFIDDGGGCFASGAGVAIAEAAFWRDVGGIGAVILKADIRGAGFIVCCCPLSSSLCAVIHFS